MAGKKSVKRVGILAIHGSVADHAEILRKLKIKPVEVREPNQLADLDGLILPGGESTTISDLAATYEIEAAVKKFTASGKLIFGTCAGMILLARWGLLDAEIDRNAYGRQLHSFEADFEIPQLGKKQFPGVFIRAPRITQLGKSIKTLAKFEDAPILVQQKNIFAASFHPELTDDDRLHRLIFG